MDIEQHIYGMSEQGDAIILYTLISDGGAQVQICNLGATITSIIMPDREGVMREVTLGYSDLESMQRDINYVGRCVGRVAGRIPYGELELEGQRVELDINVPPNHVNGGAQGLHSKLWECRFETNRVVMSLDLEDGEGGYPGAMHIEVVFDLDDDNNFEITYLAQADRTTVLNLSHNIYFNLSGEAGTTIDQHELQVNSSNMVKIDDINSELTLVDSDADFRTAKAISSCYGSDFNGIRGMRGLDHLFVIDGWKNGILGEVATLHHRSSGRRVTLLSSQSTLHVDTANCISAGSPVSRSGAKFVNHEGVALAPQALNNIEQLTLNEGVRYCQKSLYHFDVM